MKRAGHIIDLSSDEGGSGRGWSYWSMWLDGCNMRGYLCETLGIPYVSSDSALMGRVVHKLLEFHEGSKKDRDYMLAGDSKLEPYAVRDAKKLFADYRAKIRPGHWGEVISRETPIKGTVAGIDYTGRIDLVIRVLKAHQQHWLDIGALVSLGYHIVDYKTYSPPFDAEMYLNAPQFTGYWELIEQNRKHFAAVRDTLVLGIDKRSHVIKGLVVPPPTPSKRLVLHHALRLAEANSKPPYVPNVGRCGRGNYRCPFYCKQCDLHTVINKAL